MSDKQKYIRRSELDRRVANGDLHDGDAWELVDDTTEGDGWSSHRIGIVAKGIDPNKAGADGKTR